MRRRPLPHERLLVEVDRRARPPVEPDVARRRALERVPQHRLHGCEARAARDEDRRRHRFRIDELADRALDAQQRARSLVREQAAREAAPGDVAHVQLEPRGIVRRGRDRETAPLPALEQHVEVLARLEAETLHRGQAHPQPQAVRREQLERHDAAGERLDLDVGDRVDGAGLHHEIARGARAAQQDHSRRRFAGCQPEWRAVGIRDGA